MRRHLPLGPLLLLADALRGRRIYIRVDSPDEAWIRMERRDGSMFWARLERKQGLNIMHDMSERELEQFDMEEKRNGFFRT